MSLLVSSFSLIFVVVDLSPRGHRAAYTPCRDDCEALRNRRR
jgi:hypothetical protein